MRIGLIKGQRLHPDTIFQSDSLSQDLARKSIRGGMTTLFAQGAQFVLTTVTTIVLARLLTPDDYGLIGMVSVVTGFAAMFRDAGLSMATLQRERISSSQISTLFWINVLITAVLGLCILVASPVIASFYSRPELTGVTAALSMSFILGGLALQHQALLRRHMRFGALACISIASQSLSFVTTLALAYLGWRYWALVGGSLMSALTTVLLTLFWCPWVPGRICRGTGALDMVRFGAHVTAFDFANYFSRNLDNILIGRFIGADALGLYAKAYGLFMMPITQIRTPINHVAMPVLSTIHHQPERYAKYYRHLVETLAAVSIPIAIYCFVEAEFLVRTLLGSNWLGATAVFRVLAIAGVVQPVAGTRGLVLLSSGFSNRYLRWGLVNAVVTAISFVAGLPFGIEGVASAYVIVNYAILVPSLIYCFHGTSITVAQFMRAAAPSLLVGVMSGVAATLVRHAMGNSGIVVNMVTFLVFFSFYLLLSCFRRPLRTTVSLLLEGLSPSWARGSMGGNTRL